MSSQTMSDSLSMVKGVGLRAPQILTAALLVQSRVSSGQGTEAVPAGPHLMQAARAADRRVTSSSPRAFANALGRST